MALIDQYALANDLRFAQRVSAALTVALFAIETEDPATANHAARLAWVKGIRTDPGNITQQLCLGLSAHPGVLSVYLAASPATSDNVDDATLQGAVNALVASAVGV